MRKTLLYGVAAILLGMVTMLAPSMLLKPSFSDDPFQPEATLAMGGSRQEREAFSIPPSPLSLLSAGLMVLPSFLLALGVFVYVKRRMF